MTTWPAHLAGVLSAHLNDRAGCSSSRHGSRGRHGTRARAAPMESHILRDARLRCQSQCQERFIEVVLSTSCHESFIKTMTRTNSSLNSLVNVNKRLVMKVLLHRLVKHLIMTVSCRHMHCERTSSKVSSSSRRYSPHHTVNVD